MTYQKATMSSRYQLIVVGAGPVGLSVALAMARKGYRILMIEKEAGTAEHSRAPAIWPRTQEILADLGVMDRFAEAGILLPSLEMYDVDRNQRLFRAPLNALANETDYPHLLILPQSRTESLLLEALQQQASATVLFSSEVIDVRDAENEVHVNFVGPGGEESARAELLVGCDGAHSTVRHAIGAHQEGVTYGMQAALADVRIAGSGTTHSPRLTTQPRIAVGIRIEADIWRLILPFAKGDTLPLERRISDAVSHLFDQPDWEVVWRSEFQLHRRISSAFNHGRIVLAGDAAHLNSPVGGQGMNAGIQDAARLAVVLERALGAEPERVLAEYGERRRVEIARGVNRVTDRMTRVLLAGQGRYIRLVLRSADLALRLPYFGRRILRKMAMLD